MDKASKMKHEYDEKEKNKWLSEVIVPETDLFKEYS